MTACDDGNVGDNGAGNIRNNIADGSWTMRASFRDTYLNNVHYANGVWVAAGGETVKAKLLTSPSGRAWTEQEDTLEGSFYDVQYANGLWVAVGWYDSEDEVKMAVHTSTDGTTWTRQTSVLNTVLHGARYANGLWVTWGNAIYSDGSYAYGRYEATILTSTDAQTWTVQESVPNVYISNIHYADEAGLWVAAGGTNSFESATIYTSKNGRTWTDQKIEGTGGLRDIQYANGLWIARGAAIIFTSTDGITWTMRSDFADVAFIRDIHYANGLWIAIGSRDTQEPSTAVFTSTDGLAWTAQANILGASLRDIHYANGLWVAAGFGNDNNTARSNDGAVFTSIDGRTWTRQPDAPRSVVLSRLYYANGLWIAAGREIVGFRDVVDEVTKRTTETPIFNWELFTTTFPSTAAR